MPSGPTLKFSKLLQKLGDDAEARIRAKKKSFGWFLQRARILRNEARAVNSLPIKQDTALRTEKAMMVQGSTFTQQMIGRMLFYNYLPKGKDKLPYYDIYPLIFPIKLYPDGFLGINFHYLPLNLRASLMDALYTLVNDKNINEKTRLKISYEILRDAGRFAAFKPCIKRYLYGYVKSRFLLISPLEWDSAMMLPLAEFKKQSQQKIWEDSRRIINRRH